MNELVCPACGSKDVESSSVVDNCSSPYGPTVSYMLHEDHCKTCGERGDFAQVNDEAIENAICKADHESVGSMLQYLADHGHTMASVERSLGLPARTLFRWKSEGGGCSSAGLALLRFVRAYPWLLDVAGSGFAPNIVSRELLRAAVEHGVHLFQSAGFVVQATQALSAEGTFDLNAKCIPSSATSRDRTSLSPPAPFRFVA